MLNGAWSGLLPRCPEVEKAVLLSETTVMVLSAWGLGREI